MQAPTVSMDVSGVNVTIFFVSSMKFIKQQVLDIFNNKTRHFLVINDITI